MGWHYSCRQQPAQDAASATYATSVNDSAAESKPMYTVREGDCVEFFYDGKWHEGFLQHVSNGTIAYIDCDDEPELSTVAPLSAVRPVSATSCEVSGMAPSMMAANNTLRPVARCTVRKGDRVEALYEGQWFPGTLTLVTGDKCCVQCDCDEPGVYTGVSFAEVRLTQLVAMPIPEAE